MYFIGMKMERLFSTAGPITYVEELKKGFEEGRLESSWY